MANPTADFAELMGITVSYQRSRALTVATELGIADLLRDGPRPVADLAQATHTHEPTLYRLLRALASIGVFHEDSERSFSLTPMGQLLRSDAPASVGAIARFFGRDYHWIAWGHLLHSVRTGENASRAALGTDVWRYRERNPEENEIFNAAMAALSRAGAAQEMAAYDFSRHRIIAVQGHDDECSSHRSTFEGLLVTTPQRVGATDKGNALRHTPNYPAPGPVT